MPVLTAVDVLGIQRFVYSSNRLRDVVAASHVVQKLSGDDLREYSTTAGGNPLMAAAGNAVVAFPDAEHARAFARSYTRHVLESALGLDVAVVHRSYDTGELAGALLGVQLDLLREKARHRPSAPLLGLGVTAACRDTGLPAVTVAKPRRVEGRAEPDGRGPGVPLSKLSVAMRAAQRGQELHKRWSEFLPSDTTWSFPYENDHLTGRSEHDRSLVGVVHVDGNGIGSMITDWLTERLIASDDVVEREYGEFSEALSLHANHVFQSVVRRVTDNIETAADDQEKLSHRLAGEIDDLHFELVEGKLPIRPVLVGGDDLTFLADGRIALDLAAEAVRQFESDIPGLGHVTVCAGVALVGAHDPVLRAYELADKLCRSAKRERRNADWSNGAIDWHIGDTRPRATVDDIRDRQYTAPSTRGTLILTCRPYRVGGNHNRDVRSWDWFNDELLRELRGGSWQQLRGKIHALADAARGGPEAVSDLIIAWRISAPGLNLPDPLHNGYRSRATPLLDAVELIDRAQVLTS